MKKLFEFRKPYYNTYWRITKDSCEQHPFLRVYSESVPHNYKIKWVEGRGFSGNDAQILLYSWNNLGWPVFHYSLNKPNDAALELIQNELVANSLWSGEIEHG